MVALAAVARPSVSHRVNLRYIRYEDKPVVLVFLICDTVVSQRVV